MLKAARVGGTALKAIRTAPSRAMAEWNRQGDRKKRMGASAFYFDWFVTLLPVILLVGQMIALAYILIGEWLASDPPELPIEPTSPIFSLLLGIISVLYNIYALQHGKTTTAVPLLVAGIMCLVTGGIIYLAFKHPIRMACCPNGDTPIRVKKSLGHCPRPDPPPAPPPAPPPVPPPAPGPPPGLAPEPAPGLAPEPAPL
tara:strand:+ start:797 stop:1396 length:600 start_codon:yes stop_codon:yes gene_type:complete